MFHKSERLRNNDEIMKTIKKGVNLKTSFFNCKYLKSDEGRKITVIVSKKISKKAVERNRVKRIFRAEIRNFLKKNNFSKGNIIFFPGKNCLNKKSIELESFIKKVFEII